MPTWLKDAVFYEIYPQSFYDTNGDGIGDLEGIIQKLDYIKELGCNALWINPMYDSPFMDAGYDVRDYEKVAARYGTNEDAYRLFDEAHKRGIKVLLDLVPGHTSDEHAWFKASKEPEENKYSSRYVWTNGAFVGVKDHPYMAGMSDRNGAYMLNFFASQPALNYGWLERTENWMSAVDSPEANMLDQEYPEAALVSEWSNPEQAINGGGFHMDFYLDHWRNGYNTLLRDYETDGEDNSFFLKSGKGDICRFLNDYMPKYKATKKNGYISMFTCNHDTPRPANTLTPEELKIAYAFILTMPGVPFIYYGDEIGMRYMKDICSKEGGFHRTGSRTPMQWDNSANKGFSTAEAQKLYLAVDSSEDAPNVADQMNDENSLYSTTKSLVALRHMYADLQADADFNVIYAEQEKMPFVYKRGKLILAINPSGLEETISLDEFQGYQPIYTIGKVSLEDTNLTIGSSAFAVFQIK